MNDSALREHLVGLLQSEDAHVGFDEVVRDLRRDQRGVRVEGVPYTAWQLLEHLRIAQHDILEFSRDRTWESPEWPDGYWPEAAVPATVEAWDASVEAFRADLRAMCDLVSDPATDLFAPIPWGDGKTILREALLLADHNAYHLGQMITLRRLLGSWPPEEFDYGW